MPERTSTPASADRNLLFGVLTLKMGFISRDALIQAMHAWVLAKHKPLAQILVERGALREDARVAIETIVLRHLEQHDGDSRKSLTAVGPMRPVCRDLSQLSDPDLDASLTIVTAAEQTDDDPERTSEYTASLPTSAGRPTSAEQRFRVLRPHAKGGLGEVFVARDAELHREVALKEIQSRYADDRASRTRFLLEAEVTAGLEHPGIVPIYGLGTHADGRPFYAMRLIKGESLRDAIKRFHEADTPGRDPGERRLALRHLLGQFVSVCNAVAYAHSRGVLHRDLKPGNVMLGRYGETLVVDWGLAKLVDRPAGVDGATEGSLLPPAAADTTPTLAGSTVGTPEYMSPEQASGRLEALGPPSDIFSLGATLFCLLTGRAPFRGKNASEVLQKVQAGEFPTPRQVKPQVPPALESICLRALALKCECRYDSAKALADDIELWLADEPVAAHREALPARLGRWGRRHRPLVAAAVALLVTAVAALGAGVVVVRGERDRTELARRLSRQAMDEMTSQVFEDQLVRKEQLDPAQRDFLEKALGYYEDFAKEFGHTEEVRLGVAAAHLRVGLIRERLGQHEQAQAAYDRATHLYQTLTNDFPGVSPYRLGLARTHHSLGQLLVDIGRLKEAETPYREALALYEPLAAEFPDAAPNRQWLAQAHSDLGNILKNTSRPNEAEKAYRTALDLEKSLAADFPAEPEHRHRLARTYNDLGLLLAETRRYKEAEEAYGNALVLFKPLVAEFPNVTNYRQVLASTQNNLGILLKVTGRLALAEEAYRAALDLHKGLAAAYPGVPRYRQLLASTYNNLGILLKVRRRPKDAEEAYRAALDLLKPLVAVFPNVAQYGAELANTMNDLAVLLRNRKDYSASLSLLNDAQPIIQAALRVSPRHPFYRGVLCDNYQGLTETHLDLGNHARAAAAAAEMVRVAADPANDVYQAACLLSQCVPLAEKDAALPATRRQNLVRSYADQAMDALRQAVKNGYKDAAHLRKNKTLDSLRDRQDFKTLLAELEKNKN